MHPLRILQNRRPAVHQFSRFFRCTIRKLRYSALFALTLTALTCFWGCDSKKDPSASGNAATGTEKSGSGNAGAGSTEGSEKSIATKKGKVDLPAKDSQPGPIRLSLVTAESGIDFVHESGDFAEKPFPAANGSGVAACDFDLDGLVDLYFLTGSRITFDPKYENRPFNRAYRNLGDWKFRELPSHAGLAISGYSAGVAVGDFDNDGFPDVFVNCFGPDRLFHNQGDGTFVEVSDLAGMSTDQLWGTSAAFLDYDQDGLLDLYVANYAIWTMELNKYCGDRSRNVRTFCGPTTVDPAPHILYHNEGNGTWVNASKETGISELKGRGQGVLAADLNQDGWTDLYVANDMNPNFVLINDGAGHFRDESAVSGADVDYKGSSQAGMGIALGDANRDGLFDLFVTNYEGEHNAYYEARGNMQFQDVSRSRGLAAESIPWVGWGTVLADLDQDGWLDCLVTNGHTDNNFQEMGRDSPYAQPPAIWRNMKGRFSHVAGDSIGEYFSQSHVGRGLAVADFDNDGDLDVVIVHQDGKPALLRNDSRDSGALSANENAGMRRTSIRLIGKNAPRDATGVTLAITGGEFPILGSIVGGGSYASASDTRFLLSVPENCPKILDVKVTWPNGITVVHSLDTSRTDVVLFEANSP